MAAVTSTTACAPITSHTTAAGGGSLPELGKDHPPKEEKHQSLLAEKLHGFTEKLQSLGHYRCDSDANTRGRAGKIMFVTHPLTNHNHNFNHSSINSGIYSTSTAIY